MATTCRATCIGGGAVGINKGVALSTLVRDSTNVAKVYPWMATACRTTCIERYEGQAPVPRDNSIKQQLYLHYSLCDSGNVWLMACAYGLALYGNAIPSCVEKKDRWGWTAICINKRWNENFKEKSSTWTPCRPQGEPRDWTAVARRWVPCMHPNQEKQEGLSQEKETSQKGRCIRRCRQNSNPNIYLKMEMSLCCKDMICI